jgi:hypothetical protein
MIDDGPGRGFRTCDLEIKRPEPSEVALVRASHVKWWVVVVLGCPWAAGTATFSCTGRQVEPLIQKSVVEGPGTRRL